MMYALWSFSIGLSWYFLTGFIFIYGCEPACVYIHHKKGPSEARKGTESLLEVELQMAVDHHMCVGT